MNQKFRVLMVEDDSGDVRLTVEALKEAKLEIDLDVVGDGEQAMAYLRQAGPYSAKHRPDVVLLDLNLPRKSGHEVLKEIKSDPELKLLPVVILTTSEAESDLLSTYQHGANCYVTKPVGLEEFSQVVQSVGCFWFTVVRLPPEKGS